MRCIDGFFRGHLFIVIMLLIASAGTANAQEPRGRPGVVEVRIQAPMFRDLLDRLELAGDVRVIATERFDEYAAAMNQLEAEAGERLSRVMREIQQVRQAGDGADGDQAARLVQEVMSTTRGTRAESDRLREALLADVAALLNDPQADRWPAALRALHREVYLNMTAGVDSPNARLDLGIHRDVFELMDVASGVREDRRSPEEETELAAIFGDVNDSPYEILLNDEALRDLREVAREQREALEIELDGLIRRNAYPGRDLHQQLREHSMRGDIDRVRPLHDRSTAQWEETHRLLERSARAAADLIEQACGPEARHAWEMRVQAAFYPETYRPTSAERLFEWAMNLDELDEGTKQRIGQLFAVHRTEQHLIRKEGERLAREIRMNVSPRLRNMTPDNELMQAQAQHLERWKAIVERDRDALRSALPAAFHPRFDRRLLEVRREGHAGNPLRF